MIRILVVYARRCAIFHCTPPIDSLAKEFGSHRQRHLLSRWASWALASAPSWLGAPACEISCTAGQPSPERLPPQPDANHILTLIVSTRGKRSAHAGVRER